MLVIKCCTTCASSSLCFLCRADLQICAALLQSPSTLLCQPLGFPLLAQYQLKAWHPAISGSACYACVFVSAFRISDEPLIHPRRLLTNTRRENLISDHRFWSLPLHSFLFFPSSLLILQVITLSLERAILSHWLVFPVFYDQSRGSGHSQDCQGRATKFPDSMFGDTTY